MSEPAFDLEAFLAEPLTARLATNGPTLRPVWYAYEDGCFWTMTGPWTKLHARVAEDPEIALAIDVCELETGRIMQVNAAGAVEVVPFDRERGRRLLRRYLGDDEERWPEDYRAYLAEPPMEGLSMLKLVPRRLTTLDFSFEPS